MRKVLILTNLPQRDRVTDDVLAIHLRDLGFQVRVEEFLPNNRQHVIAFKPEIVVLPEVRCPYTCDFVDTLRKWGVLSVVKRCECGASYACFSKMTGYEQQTTVGVWPYNVDLELVWGEQFADIVRGAETSVGKNVHAVGAFPFDQYFMGETPIKRGGKNRLMFATGWPMADRNPEYCVPEAPLDSKIHADAYDRHRRGREKWIEGIRELHKRIGAEWDFIIRLKTGEKPVEYYESLGHRVKITPSEPVMIGLGRTDLLIHAGSTLAGEAHLFGIPAIGFCPDINEVREYTPHYLSPVCFDVGELEKMIKEVELGKPNTNMEAWSKVRIELYGHVDGKVSQRAAKLIDDLYCSNMRVLTIPDAWPLDTKDYSTSETNKAVENWICPCCKHETFTLKKNSDMIRCSYCGIALVRTPTENDVKGIG